MNEQWIGYRNKDVYYCDDCRREFDSPDDGVSHAQEIGHVVVVRTWDIGYKHGLMQPTA